MIANTGNKSINSNHVKPSAKVKKLLYSALIYMAVATLFTACKDTASQPNDNSQATVTYKDSITGDSMVYGLACDGTSDSVIVVFPFSGKDPVTYSCIAAKQAGRIIGKPSIGDWVGLMLSKEDSTEASFVINLDQLKGTWTYPVMPVLKDFAHMSKRMQRRMENKALSEMPDSVKELYMIPREYGFALKRNHVAQPVGYVYSGNTLEDDSPVEYPTLRNYTSWYMCNGQLILFSHSREAQPAGGKPAAADIDTLSFISLDEDSLVLTSHGIRYGFHRKASATKANEEAQAKAKEAAAKSTADKIK